MNDMKHWEGHKFPGTQLTFKRRLANNANSHIQVLFKCDCGTEKVLELHKVMMATTTSCGCVRREHAKGMAEKKAKNTITRKSPWKQPECLLAQVW